ncbi:MAG: PTS sugar transporter subunit IIA [Planctomycetota bacterium]|jgi:mannitol/fructose-specific phosphotransferase system IIA component (Ntr-type)
MKFLNIILKRNLILNLKAKTKRDVITEMVEALAAGKTLPKTRKAEVVSKIMAREKQGSTGLQNGLAIPHVKEYPHVKKLVGVFARSIEGVDFKSNDGKPAHLFFLLVGPSEANDQHLATLRKIARIGLDQSFCGFLLDAQSDNEIVELLIEADERFPD